MATKAADAVSTGKDTSKMKDECLGLPELQGYIDTGKKSLKIVITGKMGVGKSSLVNGLVGKEVAKEMMTPGSVTLEIQEYRLEVRGVNIVVVDCPGLGDPMGDEENLSNIATLCEGADILLYCMDMRTRMTTADTSGMMEFTQRVGEEIWTNTVFILTHGNEVPYAAKPIGWVPYLTFGLVGSSEDLERKTKFESLLKTWEEAVPKFLREKVLLTEDIVSNIAIIPAGYRQFSPPDRVDWFSEFWWTVFNRVKESARPALLGISLDRFKIGTAKHDSNVKNEELSINIPVTAGKVTGALAFGAGGGVALGALIGAIVGTVGGPAGMAVGAYAGALIGGEIGIASGGTTGAATALAIIISDVNKYKEAAKRKLKAASGKSTS